MKNTVQYIIGLILIIIPILVFIIRFQEYLISDNPKDWIEFRGFYYGMLGLIITGFIAFTVNKINIKNSRVGLQFEAYKEIVNILTRLTDAIKPMDKTNKLICETIRQTNHFWQNYLFIFKQLDKKIFIDYEQEIVKILNDFRAQPSDGIFGLEGNYGASIINKTNLLLFQIQKNMI